jgi:hypothetical protein
VQRGHWDADMLYQARRHHGAFDQQSLADAGIMAMSPPRDSEGHEHYRRHLGERRERKDSP